jgi:PAS domain S-box-containing protein
MLPPALTPDALVASIQDAIVILDSAGQVVFESPAAADILGIAPGEVLRAFGLARIHPEEREAVVRSFERTIAVPGAVSRATYRFQRGDGSWQHLEAISKNLIGDEPVNGVLITFRDVTDRIRALAAAESAGRARDEFLSRMSHELRTPLHAILGWAQLLEAGGGVNAAEAAEQIGAAGRHLLQLVEETLDLAAIREGRVRVRTGEVEVAGAVAGAVDLVIPLAEERDVQVLIRPGPELRIRADPDRLRQILLNLLGNAVKFNRYAGEVEIGWLEPRPGIGRIAVRDTGPGIPREKLHRIFERYERLESESPGAGGHGLGLAISARLAELMGGAIGVESCQAEGSVFWIDLPSSAEAA